VTARTHQFHAVAYVENFALRELASALGGGKLRPHELRFSVEGEGDVFLYPFGAVVFHDVPAAEREQWLARIRKAFPRLTTKVVAESFTAREEPGARTGFVGGSLELPVLGPARVSAVALVVAQSAAMEYYERLVDDLFGRTDALVGPLERRGTVSTRTRQLHRFIGEAISSRHEVLSVLHLLDKPDEVWDDPELDRIYDDLRADFDLTDRYQALESKLRGVQDSLELVLDVARDRRMWILEVSIALLILVELVLSFWRH
jgi:required for meiotic nuclear division protein 1